MYRSGCYFLTVASAVYIRSRRFLKSSSDYWRRDSAAEEELTPSELSVIAGLRTPVHELRDQLVAALKKTKQYMDETVEAREQLVKASGIVMKMSDQLKEQVANNLELHEKVIALEMEVQLARKDALLLRNKAMMLEKQRLEKKAKEAQLLGRELLEVGMANRGQQGVPAGPSDA